MRSAKRGKSTSTAEVVNVSEHGFWMLVDGRELFLAFEHFPWFREATVADLFRAELVEREHLRWPALDIDLTLGSVEHPERFPLVSKVHERPRARVRTRGSSRPRGTRNR